MRWLRFNSLWLWCTGVAGDDNTCGIDQVAVEDSERLSLSTNIEIYQWKDRDKNKSVKGLHWVEFQMFKTCWIMICDIVHIYFAMEQLFVNISSASVGTFLSER